MTIRCAHCGRRRLVFRVTSPLLSQARSSPSLLCSRLLRDFFGQSDGGRGRQTRRQTFRNAALSCTAGLASFLRASPSLPSSKRCQFHHVYTIVISIAKL